VKKIMPNALKILVNPHCSHLADKTAQKSDVRAKGINHVRSGRAVPSLEAVAQARIR
jgi:hypothetical protein